MNPKTHPLLLACGQQPYVVADVECICSSQKILGKNIDRNIVAIKLETQGALRSGVHVDHLDGLIPFSIDDQIRNPLSIREPHRPATDLSDLLLVGSVGGNHINAAVICATLTEGDALTVR